MKQLYVILLSSIVFSGYAQVPANYYNSASGLEGYALKTELHAIISTGYVQKSYGDLYGGYQTTDVDSYYEMDGSVLDVYSEKPAGADSYTYEHVSGDRCGSYSSEADCYNREHIIPQSVFNEALPMVSDIHQVIPTDGFVNNKRSNFPFGIVNSPTWTSTNGSKVGSNSSSGYSGDAFEPIDEFKGDIARSVLYFAVRYEGQVGSWSFPMFNGTNDRVFTEWALNILLDWHAADPVSQREIDRNNAAYNYQNNANPFISHPEYANMIWSQTADTEAPSSPTNLMVTNEASTNISLSWTASTDNIGVTSYDIYVGGTFNTTVTTNLGTVSGLTPETTYTFTVLAKDSGNNISAQSAAVNGTTTEAGTNGGECANETFSNFELPLASSYADRTWTGDNGMLWTATRARTDQSITTGNSAIAFDGRNDSNGSISSPMISGGIGALTVTTLRLFSGGTGNLTLYVNNVSKGVIPYSDVAQTTTLTGINEEGDVTIVIKEDTAGGDRVAIDNLSWTCYTTLGLEDNDLSNIKMYPNPSKLGYVTIKANQDLTAEVFDILGKKVKVQSLSQDQNKLNVSSLTQGVYLIKLSSETGSVIKKLIKQ
ncbi:putative secreted protein (Por secretion system target) [Gelidibacter algens]|uniref:Putative secreted protein (Por secretion system target) n=1 Tax=Gelidibacter algens TaxID=49280 RepID=A0A1A7QS19_9FLAO|nr:endonuclease [Gelidibacter algens]OBX22009.1 hypothetical protein A9996_17435 [Gelidibacter algens]RAJ27817.1 putative secreted protein (Por secretion system target) [Gelidibacter algens]